MLHRLKIISIILFLFIFHAQTTMAQEVSPSAVPTPIEYQLPYPGILPGHPFYFIKSFRDNILGFMISNPLKKAEFHLLQADKNLQAAVYLFEQNKSEAVFRTLQQSEEHFANAIIKAQEAKKQGIYSADLTGKITIANLKHQEIVLNLSKLAKEDDKKKFELELVRIIDLGKKAKALSAK